MPPLPDRPLQFFIIAPICARVLDQPVVFVDLDRRERRGARQRMAVVGQPAVEHLVLELCGDRTAHADAPQLHVARVSPLAIVIMSGTTFQ